MFYRELGELKWSYWRGEELFCALQRFCCSCWRVSPRLGEQGCRSAPVYLSRIVVWWGRTVVDLYSGPAWPATGTGGQDVLSFAQVSSSQQKDASVSLFNTELFFGSVKLKMWRDVYINLSLSWHSSDPRSTKAEKHPSCVGQSLIMIGSQNTCCKALTHYHIEII